MRINKKISLNPEDYGTKSKEHCNLHIVWQDRSYHSLTTANLIMEKSEQDENYDGYLWVITTSYYSMFYMALAVLSKKGWRLKKEIRDTHKNVQNLFNSIFVVNKIIDKKLYDDYNDTKNISLRLLQYLSSGRKDRNDFQYQTNIFAEKRIARKHLERSKYFFEKLFVVINEIAY